MGQGLKKGAVAAACVFMAPWTASAEPASGPRALIKALRDDDTKWNAGEALDALCELREPPLDLLNAALDSDDWQQRELAASVLWEHIHPRAWRQREPISAVTLRLLEVTVEGLAHDALPYDRDADRYTYVSNANRGFRMLSLHAKEAEPLLTLGLKSDDPQKRFLCALALGFGGVGASAHLAAPILLPHLRDNDIPEDAKWAVAALYRFGPDVFPILIRALPDADAQQHDLLRLLIADLVQPPRDRAELESRRNWNRITRQVFDPAIEPPREQSMDWLGEIGRER